MKRMRFSTFVATLLAAGWSMVATATVTLYDGSLGTLPAVQGWSAFLLGATQSVVAGGVTLDTTASDSIQAGYARSQLFGNAVTLDSNSGFALSFTSNMTSEAHQNDNRAGMSVIVLDSAHKGVELGFWTDRVFAQSLSGASFIQSATERVTSFDTTAGRTYSLQFVGNNYQLLAGGAPLFSGALHDYSSSGVTVLGVQVYSQANFLFFGDDTGSAAARWTLQAVSIAPVPEPSQVAMMVAGLLVLGGALKRRRAALALRPCAQARNARTPHPAGGRETRTGGTSGKS